MSGLETDRRAAEAHVTEVTRSQQTPPVVLPCYPPEPTDARAAGSMGRTTQLGYRSHARSLRVGRIAPVVGSRVEHPMGRPDLDDSPALHCRACTG